MSKPEDKPDKIFWQTFPGIIASLAALITAIGGCIAVVFGIPAISNAIFGVTPTPIISQTTFSPTVNIPTLTQMPTTETAGIPITSTVTVSPTFTDIPPIPREELVDGSPPNGPSVEEGMHVCPVGFAIGGVRLDQNLFLCRRVVHSGEERYVQTILDTSTQRNDMHACPSGTYMRGLNVDNNQLLCSYDSRAGQNEWQQEFEDTGASQAYNMHVCPNQPNGITFLTGIHSGNNYFLCGIFQP